MAKLAINKIREATRNWKFKLYRKSNLKSFNMLVIFKGTFIVEIDCALYID